MPEHDAVTKADDDTWTFTCPGVPGDECGPFVTSKWPRKKDAEARGAQHLAEHEHGELMQSLHDFRESQGLVANGDGSASVKGN